jgi:hypothetical protein
MVMEIFSNADTFFLNWNTRKVKGSLNLVPLVILEKILKIEIKKLIWLFMIIKYSKTMVLPT